MMTKEDFENLITSIKNKLDETTQALISEDLLGILSTYSNSLEEIKNLNDKVSKLESDKEELLKVNGSLFQKIGFDKEEEKKEEKEDNEEKLEIEDVIDEKGELI